jgi:lipoprotein-anchoring transpeptidase ErfK/SrfK
MKRHRRSCVFTKRTSLSAVIVHAIEGPSVFATIMFESTSMSRIAVPALLLSAFGAASAVANPLALSPDAGVPRAAPQEQVRYAAAPRSNLGGGLIEAIFGGVQAAPRAPAYIAPPHARRYEPDAMPTYEVEPVAHPRGSIFSPERGPMSEPARPGMDPRYRRQLVDYDGKERPGTVIIDTPRRYLFLVQEGGKAMRYGIGVGRPGFTWAGVKHISQKREWPDWVPPSEMLKRRPDLPRHMAGGPDNPLGARAMYLGSSLYRIHGSNEPWTIGQAVSSGCIRMRNEDVIDLYGRVKVGTRVIVI